MFEDTRQPEENDPMDPAYYLSDEEYSAYLDEKQRDQEEQALADWRDENERTRSYC